MAKKSIWFGFYRLAKTHHIYTCVEAKLEIDSIFNGGK